MEKHYRLEVSNHFTAISIRVNDIGLFDDHYNKTIDKKLGINQYVNTGINEIDIKLWVPPDMEVLPKKLDCSIIIAEYTGSDAKFDKKILRKIDWSWNSEAVFPVQLKDSFTVEADFPFWTWREGEKISEDFLDKSSLNLYIATLHKIMADKDYLKLAPLLKIKTNELGAALYVPESERFQDEDEFFKDIFSDPLFAMRPVDWDGLVIRYHAENRLIEVVDRKGNPPIFTTPFRDDSAFGIELYLARKNGEWILCR